MITIDSKLEIISKRVMDASKSSNKSSSQSVLHLLVRRYKDKRDSARIFFQPSHHGNQLFCLILSVL